MANSAADARSSEMEIRRQLIEDDAVDVIVAVGPNMFYTVTLPCTLWFLGPGSKARSGRQGAVSSMRGTSTAKSTARTEIGPRPDRVPRQHRPTLSWREDRLDSRWTGGQGTKLKECFGQELKLTDVPGLCRAATFRDIEAQGWCLNPGRYVGVAPGEALSDEDFKTKLEAFNEELESLERACPRDRADHLSKCGGHLER